MIVLELNQPNAGIPTSFLRDEFKTFLSVE